MASFHKWEDRVEWIVELEIRDNKRYEVEYWSRREMNSSKNKRDTKLVPWPYTGDFTITQQIDPSC